MQLVEQTFTNKPLLINPLMSSWREGILLFNLLLRYETYIERLGPGHTSVVVSRISHARTCHHRMDLG